MWPGSLVSYVRFFCEKHSSRNSPKQGDNILCPQMDIVGDLAINKIDEEYLSTPIEKVELGLISYMLATTKEGSESGGGNARYLT